MHREFDPADRPFQPRSDLGLYALTLLVGGLLLADLWPPLAAWLAGLGLDLPTFAGRQVYGFRLALVAAVLGGAKVLYAALDRLAEGRVGADLAVAIACIAAILMGEPVIAAEVVVIGLVGECLEAITFDRTQRALCGLAELFPTRCWVLRDGQEVRAFTRDLQAGDRVVVKPGGKIPVDGTVTDGRSAVDTSALTGESVPVDKGPGDTVLAGSVVTDGTLTVDAAKVAKQTVAGQVIELTATALREKGDTERLADTLARYFLPVVLTLAVVTFLFNLWLQTGPSGTEGQRVPLATAARLALYPTLAVLVVACPCPLVLATPAATIAALGRLAGTGVLVKGGAALERLAAVTGFAFDKTGTLTEGRLELGDVIAFGPDDPLRLAAVAEQGSEHPIARAVLTAARDRGLSLPPASEFLAHPGAGVTATVDGARVFVGSRRFLEQQGVSAAADAEFTRLDADGQTALLVAKDGTLAGLIGVRDRLRPEAAGVMAELRDLGLSPLVLLTGDRGTVAQAVAGNLPLTEVHAELLPAQKAEWVRRSPPPTVAFVGDGVNDAPALAAASVGIAIGTGADVAAEAGDVVMMGDPLRPLPLLVRLSRQTVRVIRQNIIGFGFGLNLVGVVLTGWLWPLFAPSAAWFESAPLAGVLFHQFGSLAVLVNSMRLLAFERTATGPTATRFRAGVRAVDRALAGLSVNDLLHELFHRWKPISAGLLGIATLGWLLSGVTQVNADQAAVVQRFGAVHADLGPGLHVRWPWPVEAVSKLRPAEVRTIEVGFRSLSAERVALLDRARAAQDKLRRPADPGQTWASGHADNIQRLTDESLLVTGDGNLVELLATVRYTVSDPRQYLFGSQNGDGVIRSAAEATFRELVAGRPFFDLLTSERAAFERRAADRLADRLRTVAPDGLGIDLQGVTVHDLHPPQEVVKAYHDVAEAIQRRDKRVNDAEADATRLRRGAEQDALRAVRQAEADAARKVADATAGRDGFLAWVAARKGLPSDAERALAAEQDALVKGGRSPADAAQVIDAKRQQLIQTRRALTDFRLTLDAVTAALRGRDKVLIDADTLPGKRHLLLMDPDTPPPPPVAFPPKEQ